MNKRFPPGAAFSTGYAPELADGHSSYPQPVLVTAETACYERTTEECAAFAPGARRRVDRRSQMATLRDERAGTGWIAFAGVMLMIAGLVDVVHGLWALDRADTRSNLLLYADKLGGWGWFYLILGIVLVLAGIGVFYRAQWARWTGVIVASIAIVGNALWVFVFPVQALILILLSSLVVYGLVVYGEAEGYGDRVR
jgi:hypothetical protein